jgi:hypothetical protein
MALLQSFSNITRATRHAAQNILSHPLAQPILPHLPDPVKSLVSADGNLEWGSWVEKGGVGEFESARVYLARWARIVAEEGERARRKEAQALVILLCRWFCGGRFFIRDLRTPTFYGESANAEDDERSFAHPVDEKMWASWFAKDGRPTVTFGVMKREIFRGGSTQREFCGRRYGHTFLVCMSGMLPRRNERNCGKQRSMHSLTCLIHVYDLVRSQYQAIKDEWCGVPDVFDSQKVLEVRIMAYMSLSIITNFRQERHRIDVDCRRTDRNQPLFAAPAQIPTTDLDDERQSISETTRLSLPSMNDIGAQSPSNEHVDCLAGILLTYNFYEKELGMPAF